MIVELDNQTSHAPSRLVVTGLNANLRIEIVETEHGLTIFAQGNQTLLIKPLASNSCELRGARQ